MRNKKLYKYEWIPNTDGTFWSLHEKTSNKVPVFGTRGYVGYVSSLLRNNTAESSKPGTSNIVTHMSIRAAAERVESWVK